MFNRKIAAALTLGMAAISTVPAAAQTPITTSTQVVTGDLDLSSEAGQRQLEIRLRGAVREVCGFQPSPRKLAEHSRYRSCVTDARDSFVWNRHIAEFETDHAGKVAQRSDQRGIPIIG